MPSEQSIREHYERLDQGDAEGFFKNIAPHAIFKITGQGNPLSGTYTSKEDFFKNYLGKIQPHLDGKMMRKTTNVIVRGEYAIIEFTGFGKGKTTGDEYAIEICWITKYEGDLIVHATTYMDSALIQKALTE